MTPTSSHAHQSAPTSKPTILVVDDEPGPRDALKVILRPFFHVETVDCAQGALDVLAKRPIDLITLDQKLPDRQGLDLLQDIKRQHNDIEVVIITGFGSLKSAMDGIRHGAAGYLLKPFNVTELITLINQTLEKKKRLDSIRECVALRQGCWSTDAEISANWAALREQYRQTGHATTTSERPPAAAEDHVTFLSTLFEAKDRNLLNHSSRVSFYATLLGNRADLSDSEQRSLATGAFLHDIGMLALGTAANNSQRTEPSCADQPRLHAEIGGRMALALGLPADVVQMISYHHERWDGKGYPNGLKGDGIPLLARIVAIAEAFDQLMTDNEGRPTWSVEDALQAMQKLSAVAYDARLLDIFTRVVMECRHSLPALAMSGSPIGSTELN
ncbi:MAG: response regulator [Nitrospiraceae bacterium]